MLESLSVIISFVILTFTKVSLGQFTNQNLNQKINKWYAQPSRDNCGSLFNCFSDPPNCQFKSNPIPNTASPSELCDSFLLYRQNPTNPNLIDFYMERAQIPVADTNKYIALGLGHTPRMDDSSVIMCYIGNDGATQEVINRHNVGHKNFEVTGAEAILGLSDTSIGFIQDEARNPGTKALACRFTRDKFAGSDRVFALALTSRDISIKSKRQTGGLLPVNVVDLNTTEVTPLKYYLMLAQGNMKGTVPQYHAVRAPYVSAQPVALANPLVTPYLGGGATVRSRVSILTRLHGIFMILAWVFFVTVATLNARHLKKALPDKKFCGGLKIWFVVHRTFNYIAVLLIIIATILIFVRVKGWSYNAFYLPRLVPWAHSITGILAVLLAVIQPALAYFRPHPGPNCPRITFNWVHRIIGIVALVLAVASIFLAIKFPYFATNPYIQSLLGLMIALVVIYGITECVLFTIHFIRQWQKRSNEDKNTYDMAPYATNGNAQIGQPQSIGSERINRWNMLKFYIVIVFSLVALALAIAMCVQVGKA